MLHGLTAVLNLTVLDEDGQLYNQEKGAEPQRRPAKPSTFTETEERIFKINLPKWGCELVLGSVDKDFVKYWRKYAGGDELLVFLTDELFDSDSEKPRMTSEGNIEWSEIDNFEHRHGVFADGEYSVEEIALKDGVTFLEGQVISANPVDQSFDSVSDVRHFSFADSVKSERSRELRSHERENSLPAMMFCAEEKGYFGTLFIATTKDFNPDLLKVHTLNISGAPSIVERFFYYENGPDSDPEEIVNFEEISTQTVSSVARVGFLNDNL